MVEFWEDLCSNVLTMPYVFVTVEEGEKKVSSKVKSSSQSHTSQTTSTMAWRGGEHVCMVVIVNTVIWLARKQILDVHCLIL